jgi:hypothetical protein
MLRREMRISHRHGNPFVAEELLHRPKVNSGHHKAASKRVAEAVSVAEKTKQRIWKPRVRAEFERLAAPPAERGAAMTKRKRPKTDAAPPIGEKLLTMREAAEVLRLNPRTVRITFSVARSRGELSADGGDLGVQTLTVEQRKQGRGWHQHFIGSWARLNCEYMPVIPAWLVRCCIDDPRRIPFLLVWKRESDGKIMEVVRLARYEGDDNYVVIKRTDGDDTVLRMIWRILPRNGGRALLLHCFCCNTPRRHVYGWEWDSFSGWSNRVRSISWRCRGCTFAGDRANRSARW